MIAILVIQIHNNIVMKAQWRSEYIERGNILESIKIV